VSTGMASAATAAAQRVLFDLWIGFELVFFLGGGAFQTPFSEGWSISTRPL